MPFPKQFTPDELSKEKVKTGKKKKKKKKSKKRKSFIPTY